jgi:hypothetical protein
MELKMIKNSKQDWTVGGTVTVAGQRFTVQAAVIDADDFAPNTFVLAGCRDSTLYRFFPHKGIDRGLERISPVWAAVTRQDRSPDVSYRARKGSSTQRRITRFQARRKYAPGPKVATPVAAAQGVL